MTATTPASSGATGLSRRGLLALATGGIATAGLTTAGLVGGADAAGAETYTEPTLTTIGSVGVTPAETARLSVVMYPTTGWLLCDGFLSFLSLSGETVASAKFAIANGHGAYLDWSPRGKLARTQIYPLVTITTDTSAPGYSDVVMGATLEVFDRLTLVTRTSNAGVLTFAGATR
jgi:hypothetical protein